MTKITFLQSSIHFRHIRKFTILWIHVVYHKNFAKHTQEHKWADFALFADDGIVKFTTIYCFKADQEICESVRLFRLSTEIETSRDIFSSPYKSLNKFEGVLAPLSLPALMLCDIKRWCRCSIYFRSLRCQFSYYGVHFWRLRYVKSDPYICKNILEYFRFHKNSDRCVIEQIPNLLLLLTMSPCLFSTKSIESKNFWRPAFIFVIYENLEYSGYFSLIVQISEHIQERNCADFNLSDSKSFEKTMISSRYAMQVFHFYEPQ